MASDTLTPCGRRRFLQGAASGLAFGALGTMVRPAFAQSSPGLRLEWQQFRNTSGYASYIDAIARMRASSDQNDPNSLAFWANAHAQLCPHGVPYFLAWHRGFIALFEQQLRIISGNDGLMLPYWDFYAAPTLPSEFTDPASGNPLYTRRVNLDMRGALSLMPFDARFYNFGRGTAYAFEALMESAPHDTCHNFIGGAMITMSAPLDPIFYIFHCNIDRLWHAWALPDGRGMPWIADSYWSGSHRYGAGVSMPREQTYYPGRLGYDYSDVSMPSALPPLARSATLRKVSSPAHEANGALTAMQARPPLAALPRSAPRTLSAGALSLGGCARFALRDGSFSAGIAPGGSHRHALRALHAALLDEENPSRKEGYRSMHVVLDDLALINLGSFGGYFYQVFLNLPESGTSSPERHFLGTVGPFEIAGAKHHGKAVLRFDASHVLAGLEQADLDAFAVSFVRINGANYPKGESVSVGEMRIEISQKAPSQRRRAASEPKGKCYC